MTYEEARNLIDEMRAEIKAKHMCRSMDGECTSEEVAEYRCRFSALSMAVEALQKQTPQKVDFGIDRSWGKEKKQPVCPVCDYFVTQTYFIGKGKKVTYCDHCGQAIDWSE